jgi:glutamate--cysteine ligase
MELSTNILVRAASRRGLTVTVLDESESLIRLDGYGRYEIVSQATKTRLDPMSVEALLRSKGATKKVLACAGVSILTGWWLPRETASEGLAGAITEQDLVVKPNVQYGGTGVGFVPRNDPNQLEAAVAEAARWCSTIIAEPWIRFPEYRFLMIAGALHSIVHRRPASVTGDGKACVRDLITAKNALRRRQGRGPDYDLRLGEVEQSTLQQAGLTADTILPDGKHVLLRLNSNIHCGGDATLVAGVHRSYIAVAGRAAKALSVAIAGIDILIENLAAPATPRNHYVLEANFNPDISIHALPTDGTGADPSDRILDALGFGPSDRFE